MIILCYDVKSELSSFLKSCIAGCPGGYHPMQGNVQGDGIERSQVPLELCKHKCDENAKCKAFQFKDENGLECVLFSESKPTGPRIDGFKFCKKLGINLVVYSYIN